MGSGSPALRGRPTPLWLGRCAITLAALAGLLGMHGLADHGVAPMDDLDGSSLSMVMPVVGVPGAHAPDGRHTVAGSLRTSDGGLAQHLGGAMAGLCLAILVAAAAWTPRGRQPVPRPAATSVQIRPRLRRTASGRAPPDPGRLSVCRC